MVEQKIELRKIRDFGQNINDTFVFLRQNLKPLLKSFFAICAVFMLAQAVFNGIYQSRSMGLLQQLFAGRTRTGSAVNRLGNIFSVEYVLTLVFMLITFTAMKVVLGAYLKHYLKNNGQQPGIEDIWALFKKYFFRIFVYNILVGLLPIIGLLFCLAPGVYFWVVLAPFALVVIIEDAGFSTAFYRCFEIIKENFWISLAIYLVAYIIYTVCTWIVGAVVGIVAGVLAYFTTKDVGTTAGVVTSFLNIFSFTFYIVFFISVALQYFSLVEERDGTGILNRIDAIGSGQNNFDQTEEQY